MTTKLSNQTESAYQAAFDGLEFKRYEFKSELRGRDILSALKLHPPEKYVLIHLNGSGASPVQLDESIDLKQSDLRFVAFADDEWRRFFINGVEACWGRRTLKVEEARVIGNIPNGDELVLGDSVDSGKALTDQGEIDLSEDGSEKLFSRPLQTDVTVYIDDKEKSIPSGSYLVADLREILGVENGYMFNVVVDGQITPLESGKNITVNNGLKFISHVPKGGSA